MRAPMSYPSLTAETVTFHGRSMWRQRRSSIMPALPVPAGSPAWWSSITCRAGTNGSSRWCANSPITATPAFPRISTFAMAPAAPTTWARGCARGRRRLADDQVVGDVAGAMAFLRAQPERESGKVGVIGFCSGGRRRRSAAPGPHRRRRRHRGLLGRQRDRRDDAEPAQRQAPSRADRHHRAFLRALLLGLFGNDDQNKTRRRTR